MSVFSEKLAVGIEDLDKLHTFVRGTKEQQVLTEGGPIPTLAKLSEDIAIKVTNVLRATSVSVVDLVAGERVFNIGEGKGFGAGDWIIATSENKYISGTVVSYIDGRLTVNAISVKGSGQATGWTIALSSPPGSQGNEGVPGPAGRGLSIQGGLASTSLLPEDAPVNDAYVINDNLWVKSETAWVDVGRFSGQNGKSAYEIAVSNGYVGTEAQWLDSLKGAGSGGGGGGGSGLYENIATEVALPSSIDIVPAQIDADAGDTFTITLNGSTFTVPPIINPKAGNTYRFVFIQDTIGNRKLTFSREYKFPGNVTPIPSTAGEAIDYMEATYTSSGFFFCRYFNGYSVTAIARILGVKYDTLAAAVSAAQDADIIYVTRSGQMTETVASIRKNIRLTIAGDPSLINVPKLHVDGSITLAGQKAIINPEYGDILIRDLWLDGAVTPDLSGSGVRGNPAVTKLRLERTKITQCENGMLLGSPDAAHTLTFGFNVELVDCDFDGNGQGNDGQSHNIYLNSRYRTLVLRTRFVNSRYGHNFKTRGAYQLLDRCHTEGSLQGRELDFPNGCILHAVNCYFIKKPGAAQANLIGIGQEGIDETRPREYIFRNCLLDNSQGANYGESWVEQRNDSIIIKFVDCVFIGPAKTIMNTPFELYYTGGPVGPEGWDQTKLGIIPKRGTYNSSGGNSFLPDDQQPVPINGPDPTLDAFPPTGSSSTPSVRPENGGSVEEPPPPVPDTTAPAITLSVSESEVTTTKSILLTAAATDNKAIKHVEFYRDGVLLDGDASAPYTLSVPLTEDDNGTIVFTAKATDTSDNATMSAAVNVVVNIVILPPSQDVAFSMDSVTESEVNSASSAAATGNKRLAAANAIVNAMRPNYRIDIYQEAVLMVKFEFSGDMVVVNDATGVSVTVRTPDLVTVLKSGDLEQGTWSFELRGGGEYARFMRGSVGAVSSGKMLTLTSNPEVGMGTELDVKFVMPASMDAA